MLLEAENVHVPAAGASAFDLLYPPNSLDGAKVLRDIQSRLLQRRRLKTGVPLTLRSRLAQMVARMAPVAALVALRWLETTHAPMLASKNILEP